MLSTPVNLRETSVIYSGLQISAIQMNIQGIEFLSLSLLLCLYFITIAFLICFSQGNSFHICYTQIPQASCPRYHDVAPLACLSHWLTLFIDTSFKTIHHQGHQVHEKV